MYVRQILFRFKFAQLGKGVDLLRRSYEQAIQMHGEPLGAIMTSLPDDVDIAFITHWRTRAEAEASPVLQFVLDQIECAAALELEPSSEILEMETEPDAPIS